MDGLVLKMRKSLVATVLLCASLAALARSAGGSVTVDVVGDGASSYEAQVSAIRAALQQVVRTTILTERRVENDALLVDRVVSSANGYVQKFQTLRESRQADRVTIEARVTVSTTPLENFLATQSGARVGFQGSSAFAEIAREREERQFRSAFLERSFLGYPHRAVEVRASRAAPIPGTSRISMTVEYWLRPEFVKVIRDAVRALSCSKDEQHNCRDVVCFAQADGYAVSGNLRNRSVDCHWLRPANDGLASVPEAGSYRVLHRRSPSLDPTRSSLPSPPPTFHLAALYLDAAGQRVAADASAERRATARRCADAAFSLPALVTVKPYSTQGRDYATYIATYPVRQDLIFETRGEEQRLARIASLELVPFYTVTSTWGDLRRHFAELVNIFSESSSTMATPPSFSTEWGIEGCFR